MDSDNHPLLSSERKFLNGRMSTHSFVFCLWVIFGIIIDQLVKYFVFSRTILPWPLDKFRNYNFAFSLPMPTWLIFSLYAIVIVCALYFCIQRFFLASKRELLGWILLLSGAFSNVGERIVLGYVRDYLVIANGVFNLADIFIIIAIMILFISSNPATSAK